MLFRLFSTPFFGLLLSLFSATLDAKVSLDGKTLHYVGEISQENNTKFQALYEQAKDKPTLLAITSGGGNIDLGMDLADLVLEYNLDVRVDTFCFSSCANYVFTSGHHKWLGANAILGWHGDAASAYWRDSDIDNMVGHLTEPRRSQEWQRLRQHYNDVIKRAILREKALFQRLGIDHSLLTIGLRSDIAKIAIERQARGWTMSPEQLLIMGLTNIKSDATPWYPKLNKQFPLIIIE